MNKPLEISLSEWQEIRALQEVIDSWGLTDDISAEEFGSWVYGVKFDFVSGSPGYVGPLYIVQGDALTGDAPFVLIRQDGALKSV